MLLIASALCMIRQSNQANSATTPILIRDTPLVSILVAAFCGSVFMPIIVIRSVPLLGASGSGQRADLHSGAGLFAVATGPLFAEI